MSAFQVARITGVSHWPWQIHPTLRNISFKNIPPKDFNLIIKYSSYTHEFKSRAFPQSF
jgi:hypothetical protein